MSKSLNLCIGNLNWAAAKRKAIHLQKLEDLSLQFTVGLGFDFGFGSSNHSFPLPLFSFFFSIIQWIHFKLGKMDFVFVGHFSVSLALRLSHLHQMLRICYTLIIFVFNNLYLMMSWGPWVSKERLPLPGLVTL